MRFIFCLAMVSSVIGCSSSSVNDESSGNGGTSTGGAAGASAGGSGGSSGASVGGNAGASAGGSAGSGGGSAGASPGNDCVVALVAGAYHTCALRTDKKVFCWSNDSQLPIEAASGMDEIAAGAIHTCGTKGGQVFCWGKNPGGQLGSGDKLDSMTPVDTGVAQAVQISAGGWTSCARTTQGVLCWGDNGAGQVGTGTAGGEFVSPTPATAVILTSLAGIVAAGGSSCSRNGSEVYCWGSNVDGALGIDSASTAPVALPAKLPLTGINAVRTTGRCVLSDVGSLYCWGLNSSGQLGDGTQVTKLGPVQVTALGTDVLTMSTTGAHMCAVKKDKTVWCWGRNDKGTLGDGTVGGDTCSNGSCKSSPVQVQGLTLAKLVATGNEHSCAAETDGSIWCWGSVPFLGTSANGRPCGTGSPCEPQPVKVTFACP